MTTTNQKYRPILFSTEMVQALLGGRKTQTRRTVKEDISNAVMQFAEENKRDTADYIKRNAPFKSGDILWVRETFAKPPITSFGKKYIYKAGFDRTFCGWKPSIHMPKEACRIFLKVTDVRCERLHDISEDDAIAEGVLYPKQPAIYQFASLWKRINGVESWESDPWVWVYEFEQIEKPEGWPI